MEGKKFATVSGVLLFPLCVGCRAIILHGTGYTHTSKVVAIHSVNYDFEQRLFYIVVDTEVSAVHPSNIYYIDHTGGKHWFTAELPQTFIEQAFLACVHAVAHEDYKIKPTEQEAYQSVAWEVGCEEEAL